jgi:RNA polymerase sigma factor (sigma-70 family)
MAFKTNSWQMDTASSVPSTGAPRRGHAAAASLAATRQSLLSRLKRPDDHDGWQRFFDTYASVIHALALRSGLSSAEADDALQETLLSVAKEIPGFRYDPERGSFKSWLFRISRRRIADQFRRRARQRRDGDDAGGIVEQVADGENDPLNRVWDDEWRRNQLQLAIEQVKQKVAPRQWQMFDLAVLQRWPTERICQVLDANRAQIYMAKMRVGRMLKSAAANLRPDGPL